MPASTFDMALRSPTVARDGNSMPSGSVSYPGIAGRLSVASFAVAGSKARCRSTRAIKDCAPFSARRTCKISLQVADEAIHDSAKGLPILSGAVVLDVHACAPFSPVNLARGNLHMSKNTLTERQMSNRCHMSQATAWADELIREETRGPGDLDNAMRRVARRANVTHGFLWKLRYRNPKDVLAGQFFNLQRAWTELKSRQMRNLRNEIEKNAALFGDESDPVQAARALVAASDEER